eukprot:superscaffoldBa00003229_g16429
MTGHDALSLYVLKAGGNASGRERQASGQPAAWRGDPGWKRQPDRERAVLGLITQTGSRRLLSEEKRTNALPHEAYELLSGSSDFLSAGRRVHNILIFASLLFDLVSIRSNGVESATVHDIAGGRSATALQVVKSFVVFLVSCSFLCFSANVGKVTISENTAASLVYRRVLKSETHPHDFY